MGKVPRAWNFNIDFIGHMNTILWVSAVLCALSIASLAVRGLNLGTDFAGGYELQVQFPRTVSETEIRGLLAPMELEDARVQRFGDEAENAYLIMVRGNSHALGDGDRRRLRGEMEKLAGGPAGLTQWSLAESGESFVVGFNTPVTEAQVRAVATAKKLVVKSLSHNERAEQPEFKVELESLADGIAQALQTGLKLPAGHELIKRVDFVGPQVGSQLRNEGIMAVVYSLLLIFIYVALRFDFYFSPGAILATLHDVILTMGFFSVFQIEFNLTVVAAILTLIGFSLNDTVVVFDRIRENVSRYRARELHALVNASINETLSRTILTSGTVLLVTLALLLFGGPFIFGLSICMFVGVVVGTYSSIAVASPLYILLREYDQRREAKQQGRAVSA